MCKKRIFYLDKISGALYQIIYAYMYTRRQPQYNTECNEMLSLASYLWLTLCWWGTCPPTPTRNTSPFAVLSFCSTFKNDCDHSLWIWHTHLQCFVWLPSNITVVLFSGCCWFISSVVIEYDDWLLLFLLPGMMFLVCNIGNIST